MTVSRPVKILALVLVIAGVSGIASLSMLGKSSAGGSPAGQLSVAQIRARAHAAASGSHAGTSTIAGSTTATRATPVKRAAKPAAPPASKPAPVVKKPALTVAANGLPIVLADALRSHRIVVVSIFDPQSQTNATAYAEARAGAGDASVGFVGVSVLDDSIAGPLTAALPGGGLLPLPGILIYRSPATLVERIDGFADRGTVASLAIEARTAPAWTAPAPAATTPAAPAPAAAPTPTTPTTTTP